MAPVAIETPHALKLRREEFKVTKGMLSTAMQRTATGITGKKAKGPLSITDNPEYSASQPTPRRASTKAVKHPPEQHPAPYQSEEDLLWHGGPTFEAQKPKPPKVPPSRKAFARYLPSHNRGNPTSSATLAAIVERKAEDAFSRQYAARPPAQLAVRLSTQVLQMCKEHQIDWTALMREGANPLVTEVDAVHGPYAPLWEEAFADEEELKRFPLKPPPKSSHTPSRQASRQATPGKAPPGSPRSARSAPEVTRSQRIQIGKTRLRARRREVEEAAAAEEAAAGGGGSQSARASRVPPGGRVRPEDVLDEMEYEKEEKAIRREMDELRKRRAEALRRRAAVQLEEQRMQDVACEKIKEHENWQEEKRLQDRKKAAQATLALKKHVAESEQAMKSRMDKEAAASRHEAERIREIWERQQDGAEEEQRAKREAHAKRVAADLRAERAREAAEAARAEARAAAVVEYQEARLEGEKEAEERAQAAAAEKKEAAQRRVEEGMKRREEALSRKAADLELAKSKAAELDAALMERQLLVEQQRKERLSQPPGGVEKHARDLERRQAAPLQVERLNVLRAQRLDSHRQELDAAAEQHRQQVETEHAKWVHGRRQQRAKAVRRVEKTFAAKVVKVAERAEKLVEYDRHQEKLEAKRILREKIVKKEREEYMIREHAMKSAVRASEQSNQGGVLGESELEAIISGGGGKKK